MTEPMTDADVAELRRLAKAAVVAEEDGALVEAGFAFDAIATPEAVLSIVARLDRAEAAGAWRPVESVPKDGTRILAFGVYRDGTPGHWTSIATLNYRGWLKDDGEPFVFGMKPDFWQPLPAPPALARPEREAE